MSYEKVKLETKLSNVKENFIGNKISRITKKYGVSRQSVYDCLKSIKRALKPYKKSETEILKERIKQLEKEIKILSSK